MSSLPAQAIASPPRTSTFSAITIWSTRHPFAALLVAAILVRSITFGNPIVHVDEQFYFATARAMWSGAIPYVDIWDRKPIGLFLLYMIPARLGLPAGIFAYQLLALVSVVCTAYLVKLMAERAGWHRGALFGGLAYVCWPNLLEGQGGQSPVFYNLLVAIAANLLVKREAARYRTAAPAMFVIGLALQIKYSVVFEGVFFGLWCMASRWKAERRVSSVLTFGAALAGLALIPTVAVALFYARIGRFDEFWFANVTAITLRHANPVINQYSDLLGMVAILSPLLSMGALVFVGMRKQGFAEAQTFAFGWLFSSIFGVLVFGTWFLHYALPILVPAAVCASGIIDRSKQARRWASVCLLAVIIGGQLLLTLKTIGRGTARQFYVLATSVNEDPGCLFVYSGPPMLYASSTRCRSTRFTFPTQLSRDRENGAIGADQMTELRRILATKPATVIMRPRYEGERADVHRVMQQAIDRNYTLRNELPLGNETISIFALKHREP